MAAISSKGEGKGGVRSRVCQAKHGSGLPGTAPYIIHVTHGCRCRRGHSAWPSEHHNEQEFGGWQAGKADGHPAKANP